MKLIIDIPEDKFDLIQMLVISGMGDYFHKIVAQGTPIPDNATNGDVMKIIFPKIGVYDEWYDEPYQKGGKE